MGDIVKLPKIIILTSGIGEGDTELNAFDKALLKAGAGNFNLSRVSSVVPPNSKIIYLSKNKQKRILPSVGHIVPVVYTCVQSKKVGSKIASVLALGIPQSYKKNNGLIFEFSAENITQKEAETICENMVKEAFKARNLEVRKIFFIGTECTVKKHNTCAISLALML